MAIALDDSAPFWHRFSGDLAGEWVSGGDSVGFTAAQVRFANGMKVEALSPFAAEQNDFLVRFLARSGPGPHHLTFKVPDIETALARVRAAGHEPVGVDLSDPGWKEGFLHPKSSHGIVVQLAQAEGEWWSPPPHDLPPPALDRPATLLHVTHAVRDLENALELFKGVLGGTTLDAGAGGGLGWVDLGWPGPGRLRLLSGSAVEPWLGTRPGRLHHLAFALPDPASVPDATESDGCCVVPASGPIGTRLVLVEEGELPPPQPRDPV